MRADPATTSSTDMTGVRATTRILSLLPTSNSNQARDLRTPWTSSKSESRLHVMFPGRKMLGWVHTARRSCPSSFGRNTQVQISKNRRVHIYDRKRVFILFGSLWVHLGRFVSLWAALCIFGPLWVALCRFAMMCSFFAVMCCEMIFIALHSFALLCKEELL